MRLEPQNAEIRQQLAELRSKRSSKFEFGKDFKKIFQKELYKEEMNETPVLRAVAPGRCVVSASQLRFGYDSSDELLRGVDLELLEGRCLGLVGLNASGKSTVARLLSEKLRGGKGFVKHHFGPSEKPLATPKPWATAWATAWALPLLLALLWRDALAAAALLGLSVLLFWWSRPSAKKHLVLHLSSESSDKERRSPADGINKCIERYKVKVKIRK